VTYLFNTPDQQQEMLRTIGAESIEALFAEQIPAELRMKRPLDLPPAETEIELEARVRGLAARNAGASTRVSFAGGGAYDHFIPAAVDEIASRGEYYTAYTPYQAEASQGTLQTFFEYQTLVCQLTGMDVANASLYEGGSAVAEAAFMAMRTTDRHSRIVVLGSMHPEYRQVLETYLANLSCEIVVVPTPGGAADPDDVAKALDDNTAALIIQQPNFFGCLEEVKALCELARARGAMAVVSFDPISLGVLARPGDYGADIAVAEGQSLGTPLQYGGPFLGMLACRNEFVRKMPGRLIGETSDQSGRRCFVLNLQAREQHIRRDKATSNICTNQGLLALRATTYLALLGPQGLREAAELCVQKSHYAAEQLTKIAGVELMFSRSFFKEFTLKVKGSASALAKKARAAGFDLGPDLSRMPGLSNAGLTSNEGLVVAVTEKRTRDEIDRLAAALAK
jgi:glycine dehydrogenase subunit 1